jgi:hypothetical protein
MNKKALLPLRFNSVKSSAHGLVFTPSSVFTAIVVAVVDDGTKATRQSTPNLHINFLSISESLCATRKKKSSKKKNKKNYAKKKRKKKRASV